MTEIALSGRCSKREEKLGLRRNGAQFGQILGHEVFMDDGQRGLVSVFLLDDVSEREKQPIHRISQKRLEVRRRVSV